MSGASQTQVGSALSADRSAAWKPFASVSTRARPVTSEVPGLDRKPFGCSVFGQLCTRTGDDSRNAEGPLPEWHARYLNGAVA